MNPTNASHLSRASEATAAAAHDAQHRGATAFPTETLLTQLENDIETLGAALTGAIQGMATKVAALRDRYFELQHQLQQVAHDRPAPSLTVIAASNEHVSQSENPQGAHLDHDDDGHDGASSVSPNGGTPVQTDDSLAEDLDAHFEQAATAQPEATTLRAAPSGMRRPGVTRQEVTDAVYTQPATERQRPAAQPTAAPLPQTSGHTGASGGMRRPGQVNAVARPAPAARTSVPPQGLDPMGAAPTRGMRRMGSAG